ncbi:MAG: hypothetical protein R2718_01715 [Solirubrobacterales bacterium]|nr:hypothetical protein [Solirubrobacterales bacterium]
MTDATASRPVLPGRDHPIDGIVRCAVCGRFPLVGEQVTTHAAGDARASVCETCESSGRGARLGAVTGSDRVRSVGGAANVHRAA